MNAKQGTEVYMFMYVNKVVNPFTTKDAIWNRGVITHPEMNL